MIMIMIKVTSEACFSSQSYKTIVTYQKNVTVFFLFRDDSIWLLELSGNPQTKRDINLSDNSEAICKKMSKSQLAKERKKFNMR